MFHRLRFTSTFSFNSSRFFRNSGFQFNSSLLRRGSRIPLFTAACLAFIPATINLQEEKAIEPQTIENEKMPKVALPAIKFSIWSRIWHAIVHAVRFLQLVIIFIPPIVLSPLLLIKWTRSLWMDIFVKSIEKSGVVFIKAFQYLSHRRDIIGSELAAKFEYLRENAPTHSLEETKLNFKEAYGKDIYDIFEEFDPIPIASGSVSQVYKAIYKGKKVAVKVRHPNVDKYIERDINLLFFLSYIASLFSPAM
jgi:predicted unusual protein kinase regulating ubiquinone biosynthesis (AarF/ABC1/UbiB family)